MDIQSIKKKIQYPHSCSHFNSLHSGKGKIMKTAKIMETEKMGGLGAEMGVGRDE